jgi:glutamate dehydrogenase/leucine dehydrogenase
LEGERDFWNVAQVNEKLRAVMTKAFASTLEMSLREKVNMRTAAYMLGVQRVADATTVRGLCL